MPNKNYFKAISVLSGTILGAGLFAVPFAIQKAGILTLFIYLPALAFVQFLLHKIYAEVVLSTTRRHRMPGYVGVYYGKFYRNLALAISVIGKHGALLSYIILGGIFLHGLLGDFLGGNLFLYTCVLFSAEVLIVFFGLKVIAKAEMWLNLLLVFVVLALIGKSFYYINPGNYNLLNWENLLFPYGVVFFAVGGQAAIPEMCRLLKNEKHRISSAIAWGTLLPAGIMGVFVLLIVGVCGAGVSSDTLTGLETMFGDGLIKTAFLLGLLATTTSFIVICQSLREVYWWDAGINNNLAWILACLTPFLLYLVGFSNLTQVVGITGSITGGLFGVILIAILFRAKKKRRKTPAVNNKLNLYFGVILSLLFILGVLAEVVLSFIS
ncbi:MAG: aromatic amino acid transport family protein [Candidatus Moraniibacteriota bacterium]